MTRRITLSIISIFLFVQVVYAAVPTIRKFDKKGNLLDSKTNSGALESIEALGANRYLLGKRTGTKTELLYVYIDFTRNFITTLKVIKSVANGFTGKNNFFGVDTDGKAIYLFHKFAGFAATNGVQRLDWNGNKIRNVGPLSGNVRGLTMNQGKGWTRLNSTALGTQIRTHDFAGHTIRNVSFSVANCTGLTFDGHHYYIVDGSSSIYKVNLDGILMKTITGSGGTYTDITTDGKYLYTVGT